MDIAHGFGAYARHALSHDCTCTLNRLYIHRHPCIRSATTLTGKLIAADCWRSGVSSVRVLEYQIGRAVNDDEDVDGDEVIDTDVIDNDDDG